MLLMEGCNYYEQWWMLHERDITCRVNKRRTKEKHQVLENRQQVDSWSFIQPLIYHVVGEIQNGQKCFIPYGVLGTVDLWLVAATKNIKEQELQGSLGWRYLPGIQDETSAIKVNVTSCTIIAHTCNQTGNTTHPACLRGVLWAHPLPLLHLCTCHTLELLNGPVNCLVTIIKTCSPWSHFRHGTLPMSRLIVCLTMVQHGVQLVNEPRWTLVTKAANTIPGASPSVIIDACKE